MHGQAGRTASAGFNRAARDAGDSPASAPTSSAAPTPAATVDTGTDTTVSCTHAYPAVTPTPSSTPSTPPSSASSTASTRNCWSEVSDTVLGEVHRLDDLVGDLLQLARLDETGGARATTGDVDLDELATAEVRRLRGLGAAVDDGGVGAARVRGDRAALSRALRNLVDNAARHARSAVAVGVVAASRAAAAVRQRAARAPIDRAKRDGAEEAPHQGVRPRPRSITSS